MKLKNVSARAVIRARLAWGSVFLVFALQSAGQTTASQTTGTEEKSAQSAPSESSDATMVTMFEHPASWPFWISGQANVIFQAHGSFPAKYSGPNSLSNKSEWAMSSVETLYTGWTPTKRTELLFNLEQTSGGGISDALGVAGFTNLDVVRNPSLGPKPYVARAEFHHVFPLSAQEVEAERQPLSILGTLPVRRLEVRFGKLSTADLFDQNAVGTDSHLQFLNWTLDNNGAYDYAADTRGYTYGVELEYQDRNWGVKFGEMLMPTVANGIKVEWNLHRARAENIELELRPKLLAKRETSIKLLSFVNHANMGVYRTAIDNFLAGKTPVPDITAHPFKTTVKYGFGINVEQDITGDVRVFGRFGWNEGQHESYAYTEVDQTVEVGGDIRGTGWRRKQDKAGMAFVSNGISKVHQEYLALGGQGFLLGDGRLNYGREEIVEGYYTLHVWRGIFTGPDLQQINNPGYNRDRGPVLVPGMRLHLEF